MALREKGLPHKRKDLSLIPRTCRKNLGTMAHTYNARAGEGFSGIPEASAHLIQAKK